MVHGKQRKGASRFQHPEIFAVQILSHHFCGSKFVLPVPEPRSKALIIPGIIRFSQNEGEFAGKAQVIPGLKDPDTAAHFKAGGICFIDIRKSESRAGWNTECPPGSQPSVGKFCFSYGAS